MEMFWQEVEATKKALPGVAASRRAGKSYPNRKSHLNNLNTLSFNTPYQIERKFYKLTKNSLVRNINKRKKAGTSRSKKNNTVSDKAYKDMKAGWPKKGRKSKWPPQRIAPMWRPLF